MDDFRYSPIKKPCAVCGQATKSRKGMTPLHKDCDKK